MVLLMLLYVIADTSARHGFAEMVWALKQEPSMNWVVDMCWLDEDLIGVTMRNLVKHIDSRSVLVEAIDRYLSKIGFELKAAD